MKFKSFMLLICFASTLIVLSTQAESKNHRGNPTLNGGKCSQPQALGGSDNKPRWACRNGEAVAPRGGCPDYVSSSGVKKKSKWGMSRSLGHGACNWV